MSWSINVMGKGSAIQEAAAEQAKHVCAEPEESMKQRALEAIGAAGKACPDSGFIIQANGSQWTDNGVVKGCNMQLKIELVQLVGV